MSSTFWLEAPKAPATDRLRKTLLPRSKLNVGPPVLAHLRRRDGGVRLGRGVVGGDGRRDGGVRLGAGGVNREGRRDCSVPLGHRPVGQQRIGDGLVHLDRGAEGHQPHREGGVRLGAGVVGLREGCRNGGVPLDRRFEGHQRMGDLGRGAVIGQLGVRVALALVDGRHHGEGYFGAGEVVSECSGDGVVGLGGAVGVAGEGQGPIIVGELDAQGSDGVQASDLVGPRQQVPGDLALPVGGVDKIGCTAEGCDLGQEPVDGGLEGKLQGRQLRPRGVGAGVLDGSVVAVQPGILEGLPGVVGRLGQVRSAVATRWSTSAAVCRAATSMASCGEGRSGSTAAAYVQIRQTRSTLRVFLRRLSRQASSPRWPPRRRPSRL